MIYFDAAATTLQKPKAVRLAVTRAMERCASVGRGGHAPAAAAAETVFACRQAAGELFHVADPENVVFTLNATHALNLAIKSGGHLWLLAQCRHPALAGAGVRDPGGQSASVSARGYAGGL